MTSAEKIFHNKPALLRLAETTYQARRVRSSRHPAGWLLALALLLAFIIQLPNRQALAQTATPVAPEGFQLLLSGEGVWLFKRDYPNGTPDYVQVVDLSRDARLLLLYADIIQPRPGRGVYGGDDPRFSLQPLDMFWDEALLQAPRTFCVSNGSFFYMPETPTRLAFPLKVDGRRITDGFGILTYPEKKLMLELWDDHADIRELTYENLNYSSAPNIIAGLKEDANKKAKFAVARTFVGLADRDRDRRYETVLILNTSTAVQAEAAQTLREFQADKVMMLDGGGSTQLLCQGESVIQSERLIPQALAVVEGGPQPISAKATTGLLWLVARPGEDIPLRLEVANDGAESWQPGENLFQYEDADRRMKGELPIVRTVPPGDRAEFELRIPAFHNTGLHTIRLFWYITHAGKRIAGNPVEVRVAVLATAEPSPTEQAGLPPPQVIITGRPEKPATQAEPAPVLESAPPLGSQAAIETNGGSLQVGNPLWVPVLILPFALVVLVLALHRRRSR